LDYRLRARAVHRAIIAVRGGTPPPVYLNTPEWDHVPWEQAIVDGRSAAVVPQLLLQELAAIESQILSERRNPGRQLTLTLRKNEDLWAFDEVTYIINLWIVEYPDWTPALVARQTARLEHNTPIPVPAQCPRSVPRAHLVVPDPTAPSVLPQEMVKVPALPILLQWN
jgi:hypothetical protein